MATSTCNSKRKAHTGFSGGQETSLVSELQEIQKHTEQVKKAHEWAKNLRCLHYTEASGRCFRIQYNKDLRDEFVAVSWTRQPSPWESPRSVKYATSRPRGGSAGRLKLQEQHLDIRDCVLDRVVKYLHSSRIELFWIDKACIDQDNSSKKAEAINSMDLVYKSATKTVELVSNPILTTTDAQLLADLFDGTLTIFDGSSGFCFYKNIGYESIRRVIGLLRGLVEDSWWKRAWIYQEEYLSGTHIDLLIPLASGVQIPPDCKFKYRKVHGEFCVRATRFREQATRFIMACSTTEHREACPTLLEKAERYSITLKRSETALKPMSSRIFADIQRRDVEQPWDTLAIIANSCGYPVRLKIEDLKSKALELNHCLLAQSLLNGEIFTPEAGHDLDLLEDNISEFLNQIQPEFRDLPVGRQRLTFLKYCRLPKVTLCDQGLRTQGYVWELPAHMIVETSDFRVRKLTDLSVWTRERLENFPWQSSELKKLTGKLKRRGFDTHAKWLYEYRKLAKYRKPSPANAYMHLMASRLLHAINCQLPLQLADLANSSGSHGRPASSIFISQSRLTHVLTTWRPPSKADPRKHTLQENDDIGNAVSMQVSMRSGRVESLTQWINGMVFFDTERDQKDVIIEWPESWKGDRIELNGSNPSDL